MAQTSSTSLEYIINHVVLPPQLPSSAEAFQVVNNGENDILRLALQSVQELSRYCPDVLKPVLALLEKTLLQWATINASGHLSTNLLMKWLANLEIDGMTQPSFSLS